MPRKKKKVLNQVIEEPKVMIKSEGKVIEQKPVIEQSLAGLENDDSPQYIIPEEPEISESDMISLKDSGEILAELKEKEDEDFDDSEEDVDEEVIETVPRPAGVRSLNKDVLSTLSRREVRWFQRTGKLPQ